jgi:hypothetical protein
LKQRPEACLATFSVFQLADPGSRGCLAKSLAALAEKVAKLDLAEKAARIGTASADLAEKLGKNICRTFDFHLRRHE